MSDKQVEVEARGWISFSTERVARPTDKLAMNYRMPRQTLLVSFSVVQGTVGMLSSFPGDVHIVKVKEFLVDEESRLSTFR